MKKIIISFLILFSGAMIAQSGKVVYKYFPAKISINEYNKSAKKKIDKNNKTQMRAFKQFSIWNEMAKDFEFILKFNKNESIFKTDAGLASENEKSMLSPDVVKKLFGGGITYQDLNTNTFYTQKTVWGDLYLIYRPIFSDWKITSETKMIGKYKVYKATRINEKSKEITTVWFTPEIPASFGPKGYGHLPGLILELSTGNAGYYRAVSVELRTKPFKIKKPKEGELVTYKEYKAIMKKMKKQAKGYY